MQINDKKLEKEIVERINLTFNTKDFNFYDKKELEKQRSETQIELQSYLFVIRDLKECSLEPSKSLQGLERLIDKLYINTLELSFYFSPYSLLDLYSMFKEYIEERKIKLKKGNRVEWLYRNQKTGKLEEISKLEDKRPKEFK